MVNSCSPCHQIHDAVAGAELPMRLAEPVGQHAVFGDAHQHAGRTDDRGIDRAGKNQEADDHDKNAEDNPQHLRPDHVHRQAGDQVVAVNRHAHRVGDQHHRQQRTDAGEEEAVDRDHDRGALQVLELGMLDLAVDLGQRFLAAHGQHRMAEGHQDAEQAQHRRQLGVPRKPSASLLKCRFDGTWQRRQIGPDVEGRIDPPAQQDHHHDRGDLHDFQGLVAGFLDALQMFCHQ